MSNGYLRFNPYRTKNGDLKLYANAGIGKQKFNAYCCNADPINKWGKLHKDAHLSSGMSRALSAWWECLGVGKNTPAPAIELCEKCRHAPAICESCKKQEKQTEFLLSREEVDSLKNREDYALVDIPCYAGKDYVITYLLVTNIARCFQFLMDSDGGYLAIIRPLHSKEQASVFLLQFYSIDRFFSIKL